MRTSNPTLNQNTFARSDWSMTPDIARVEGAASRRASTMTLGGTITKTGVLFSLCVVSATVAWSMAREGSALAPAVGWGGLIAAVVAALVLFFAPKTSPVLAPIYAVCEGCFLGFVSFLVNEKFAGGMAKGMLAGSIVLQAVLITFGIFAALLAAYSLRLVRLGSTATKVVIVATTGLMLTYAVTALVNIAFGKDLLPFIHGSGPLGIGFSIFVVVLASLNLVLDFQFIEGGVESGAPKHMEWYSGYALLVTMVWLYLEVLRLLSKLRKD
jgi:uncharacterized YccA/Bax inhibitor family protein